MATLSMAQVTFSDEIGHTNKTLVMMICREDGVILKPDRPATAIDAQFNAMMFGTWPGPTPAPTPPSPKPRPKNGLQLVPCNAQDNQQQWMSDGVGALSLASDVDIHGYHSCVDIGKCGKSAGDSVHIFHNPDGCGNKTAGNSCETKNEHWSLVDDHIQSKLNPKMCIKASASALAGAMLSSCAGATEFVYPLKFPGLVKATKAAENNASLCLAVTGTDSMRATTARASISAGTPLTDWEAAGYSHNYAGALQISEQLLRNIEKRERDAGGQCVMGPQGPKGEVYSTHTTIGNYTWHYLVGVQLGRGGLQVTPAMIGLNNGRKGPSMVQVPWSDATTFKLPAQQVPAPFSSDSPVQLHASSSGAGQAVTGPVDQYDARIQYHTLAPVFPDGWVFLGEAQKLVPVARQRVRELTVSASGFVVELMGKPGEAVEVGAYHAGHGATYVTCTLSTEGKASFSASSNGTTCN
jgi:hypothetical protein